MSMQTWGETLISAQVDGTALANSTTATSILPGAAKFTLPANFFLPGRVLRLNAWGRISNIVTTPGTLTLDVRLGSTVAFNGGAMALNTTAKTNVSWRAIIMLTCRSIGSGTSATLFGQGDWCSESAVGSASGVANDILMPASAPAVGTGFDSTASQAVDLFATFSIANAGNSIQLHEYTLEALN
ncbi:hypothetical protein [Amycolatopsis kentuckyensis]|uniref:hypothetical protein n=1 Tax=Amycolatopsis kentuckyensis TaxID=218823 RepID=UPI000A3D1F7B|nr:hypothetical protein [Amycolatopsis kentuckyensis]